MPFPGLKPVEMYSGAFEISSFCFEDGGKLFFEKIHKNEFLKNSEKA